MIIQTQIARTYSLNLEFKQAHAILDNVEKDLTVLSSPILHIRYYLERGRTYNSSKVRDKAIFCFKKAISIAHENMVEELEVDALHMMGIAEEDPLKQIEWNEKAIAIAENSQSKATQRWLGPLLNNTGWSVFDLKKFDKALGIFEKSLAFRQKEGKPEKIAIAMWCIARTFRALNDIDKSLELQLEVKDFREMNNLKKGGYNYEELGELYLLKQLKQQSQYNFKEAFTLLSQDKWLVTNEPERLERIKQLASFT